MKNSTREVRNWPSEDAAARDLCSRPLLAVSVQIPCCPRMYTGTRFERVWQRLRDPDWGKRFIGCIYMALPTVNHPSTTVKARPDCSRRLCLFLAENRTSALSRSVAVHQNTSVPSGSRDFQPVSSLLEDSEGVKAETSVAKLLSFWLKTPLTVQF